MDLYYNKFNASLQLSLILMLSFLVKFTDHTYTEELPQVSW